MTARIGGRMCAAVLMAMALGASRGASAQTAPQQAQATAQGATPVADANARALSLDEALALADRAHDSVRIAAAEVTRAEAQVRQSRSELFPQLDATSSYTRTLHSEFQDINLDFGGSGSTDLNSLPFGQANQYRLGLTLDQSLWSGGRVQAQTRAARAGVTSATTGLSAARADVALQVTQAYFDALLLDRLVGISEQTLEQASRAFEQTKLAKQVGDQSEFELLRAQVARDNERPQLVQRRATRDLAYARLAQLLDLPPSQPLRLTTGFVQFDTWQSKLAVPVMAERNAWLDRVTDERAPVRQARAALEAQEQLVLVAHAGRLPAVGLTSDYGRVAYPIGGLPAWSDTRTNWTVGVGLRVPVLNGGRLAAQEAAAKATAEEARARFHQVHELAWLDARDALDQLAAAEAVWGTTSGTIAQAQRAYQIAELRYREGLSTQLELNDTRIQLTLAQGNAALAARNLQVARARVALLPDLPLGAGANSTLAAGAATSTGGAALPQTTNPLTTPSTPITGASNPTFTSSGGTP